MVVLVLLSEIPSPLLERIRVLPLTRLELAYALCGEAAVEEADAVVVAILLFVVVVKEVGSSILFAAMATSCKVPALV